jgi:Uma2 family endonuclease
MATAALIHCTPEEYLARDRFAEFKSEYLEGRVVAMTPGGSVPHNFITGNVYSGLLARFEGRPCHVFFSDLRVRFGAGRDYTYPDVMALCETPSYEDAVQDTILNPSLIVEVLSPSTEAHDRGTKFSGYKALESLRHYVLISQDELKVEVFSRQGELWAYSVETSLDASIDLDAIGCGLPLREIYRRTRLLPGTHEPPAG